METQDQTTASSAITRNPDGTITIKLETPVADGAAMLSELLIRRPKAKAWRRISIGVKADGAIDLPMGTFLEVLADCAGVTSLVIDELDTADMLRAVGELAGFLEGGAATGAPG